MYEKKLPFDIDCGIRIAMEVIGGKWKSCIIFELAEGPKRSSELHRLFQEDNCPWSRNGLDFPYSMAVEGKKPLPNHQKRIFP